MEILSYLIKIPKASRSKIEVVLDEISEPGIKYHLKKLQELGLLKRIGADRDGDWEVLLID